METSTTSAFESFLSALLLAPVLATAQEPPMDAPRPDQQAFRALLLKMRSPLA